MHYSIPLSEKIADSYEFSKIPFISFIIVAAFSVLHEQIAIGSFSDSLSDILVSHNSFDHFIS